METFQISLGLALSVVNVTLTAVVGILLFILVKAVRQNGQNINDLKKSDDAIRAKHREAAELKAMLQKTQMFRNEEKKSSEYWKKRYEDLSVRFDDLQSHRIPQLQNSLDAARSSFNDNANEVRRLTDVLYELGYNTDGGKLNGNNE